MKHKTMIIGCGGSGIQTLIRLNAMFAGNRNCIDDMYENLIYITVDTDDKDTRQLEEAVKDQMGGVKPPLIHSFFLPGNGKFPTLESIVNKYFDDEKRGKKSPEGGYERLKEFWWHCPNENGELGKGEPFRGYRLDRFIDGASQCGAASFMATWANLPKFKREMEDVCDRTLRRERTSDPWNIYIVAGTAGGTGRGCWWLVAYKIYQCLVEILPEGSVNVPKGIFFDASCFDSLDDDRPIDAIRKKINSLTAYSELSVWLELTKRNKGYNLSLPNLASPDTSTETDVLHVRERKKGGLGVEKSPVRSAFIITRKNQDGVALKKHEEYYEMAAAALYAMIAEKSVASSNNNRPEPIGSFSSCTFELDTNRLNLFLKNEVQRIFAKSLNAHSVTGDEMDKDADKLIGNPKGTFDANDIQNDDNCFFAQTGFDASDNIATVVLQGGTSSRPLPTLMQDICKNLLRDQKDKKGNKTGVQEFAYTDKFVSLLEDAQDPKKAQGFASSALSLEDPEFNINDILDKWSPAGRKWTLNSDELKKAITDTILYSFTCGGENSASLGRALAVATKLKNYFECSYYNLTGDVRIPVGKSYLSSIKKAQEDFNELINQMAADNPLFAFGTPFQKDEIKNLREQFQVFMRCAVFFKLQKPLTRKFEDAVTFVDKIIKSLNDMMTLLEDVENCFDRKLCEKFGTNFTRVDVYNELFVRDDNDTILASLKPSNSSQNVFHRVLMPIMDPKDVENLIKSSKRVLSSDAIKNTLTEVFNDFVNNKYKSVESAIDNGLLESIMSLIENNVFFDEGTFSTTFTFEKILKNNIEKWNRLLQQRDTDDLRDRFARYLGVRRDNEGYTKDPKNNGDRLVYHKVVKCIVFDMLASCKPWLSATDDELLLTQDKVLLLPFSLSKKIGTSNNTLLAESDFTDDKNFKTVKLVHPGQPDGKSLPTDRIIAYVGFQIGSESGTVKELMEAITSLEYWADASIKNRMVLTESKEGRAFFVQGEDNEWEENNYAAGFVSPIFLNNEELSSLRWKPWGDGNQQDIAGETEQQVNSALLYALLGNGLAPESSVFKTLSEYGVQLPLLVMGGEGRKPEEFSFTRRQYVWKDGDEKPKDTSDPQWKKAGEALENSLDNTYRYLQGLGRPAKDVPLSKIAQDRVEGKAKREAILKERNGFETFIRPLLGIAKYRELVDALNEWIIKQSESASTADRAFWEKLQKALNAELEKPKKS